MITTTSLATDSKHTHSSSYREMLLEHLFIGELLKYLWCNEITQTEVLKPQVDNSGYDLVIEVNSIIRHIQLKSSYRGSVTNGVNVNIGLQKKPSGCVIWLQFDPETLELGPFCWFGGEPGKPLPDISTFPIARHTKGNAKGMKSGRPNIREIPGLNSSRSTTLMN
jgi:hypothetical protein